MYEFLALRYRNIDERDLQSKFDEGWEYVSGLSQSVGGSGQYSSIVWGDILIILKRLKPIEIAL